MTDVIIHIKDKAITNKPVIKKFFDELADGKYLITAKSIKRRTLPQNAYLHAVIIPLVFQGLRDVGYDDVRDFEDAKTVIKTLFLKRKIENRHTGEVIEIIRRTRDLTTIEMMTLIEEVAKWSIEYLNVYIPMPNEQSIMFCEYDKEINATIIK